MNEAPIPLPTIENAIREVCLALGEKGQQSPSWTALTEDDLWRELVACILGSRVRFEIAYCAIEQMKKERLLCQSRRSSQFEQYEQDVKKALSEASAPIDTHGVRHHYPFFRVRANQIRQAAEHLYGCHKTIRSFLGEALDIREARRRLATEISGLGPKQASLFLRNIGYAEHVAVLDIHVLTYMSWVGLTKVPIKVVSTVRKYEALEDVFIEHASSFGYTPDRFDLAVWVVMRVAKEELKTWE